MPDAATHASLRESSEAAPAGVIRTPFGPIREDPERAIRLPNGLFGFPEAERFQLEHLPGIEGGLKLLQSVDGGGLSFIVAPLDPDNAPIRVDDLEPVRRALGIAARDLVVLLIVTTARMAGGLRLFANLRAPVLIDSSSRTGAQVVLASPDYPIRHPLTPDPAAA